MHGGSSVRVQAIFPQVSYVLQDHDSRRPSLGKVEHYYWKKEYQSRGAPHYHVLLWVQDAPVMGKDPPEKVLAWIRERVTCHIPDQKNNPELHRMETRYQLPTTAGGGASVATPTSPLQVWLSAPSARACGRSQRECHAKKVSAHLRD